MPTTPSATNQLMARLGGGILATARLCVIVPAVFIMVYVLLAVLMPRGLVPVWVWLQRGVVSAGILGVLWIFTRYPLHSRRPAGLTHALAVSFMLVVPAVVTGFWPGIVGAFLTPLLVAGSAVMERFRGV